MGFIVGAVWIGSRSSAGELVAAGGLEEKLALYDLRYEPLLMLVRAAILVLPVVFVWLCLTRRSFCPRAIAILNPIFLIIVALILFFTVPAVGKFLVPIALNLAFSVLFSVSLVVASRRQSED